MPLLPEAPNLVRGRCPVRLEFHRIDVSPHPP
jgi:hypothetical protein